MNYKYELDTWICLSCTRKFTSKQAVTSHIYRSHTNPGKAFGGRKKGATAWNKGLTKDTDQRVLKASISVSKTLKGRPGIPHTEETKLKLSRIMSTNNKGGRSKWYEVSGQKVQGTWERDIAHKLNEMNISWEKLKTNNHTFTYELDGKTRNYTPDFYLKDFDIYLEIKGYWWGNDKSKMDIVMSKYPNVRFIIIEKFEYNKILQGELVW